MSVCYLIHFNSKIGNPANRRGQAQHYLGCTSSLKRRMADHRSGNGSKIMAAVARAGVSWRLARTWSHGTRKLEKRLKAQKNAPRLCPICQAHGGVSR